MSLAQPKKKQRIVADPNNKKWSEDKGGFGFKMLQKMGWKEGSGLGANLDGSVEHVKVTLKTDSAGLGVTKRDLLEDTYGHTKGYDELLKSLAASTEAKQQKKLKKDKKRGSEKTKKEIKKDEKTEKKDKKKKTETEISKPKNQRLHRKKFIQNKDVSGYSETQLREIFGV